MSAVSAANYLICADSLTPNPYEMQSVQVSRLSYISTERKGFEFILSKDGRTGKLQIDARQLTPAERSAGQVCVDYHNQWTDKRGVCTALFKQAVQPYLEHPAFNLQSADHNFGIDTEIGIRKAFYKRYAVKFEAYQMALISLKDPKLILQRGFLTPMEWDRSVEGKDLVEMAEACESAVAKIDALYQIIQPKIREMLKAVGF